MSRWHCAPVQLALLLSVVAATLPATREARAESATASGGPPAGPLSAAARLDFILNIGKFLFLRVGTGAYPAPSNPTVDTVSFMLQASIPAVPTIPTLTVNSAPVNWSGAAPTFSVVGTNFVVPVEVRSNAGQIAVATTVNSGLVSGPNSIPFSQITVASSSANLPAPLIPNSGTGATVNVAGSAFANLVTIRSANWTFSYIPLTTPLPGTYGGQLSFTATSP